MTTKSKSTKKLSGYYAAYDAVNHCYMVVDRKRQVVASGMTKQEASDYAWRNRFV